MDTTVVVNVFIQGLWWLIPLLLIAGIFKSAWFVGHLGELIVRLFGKILLNQDVYHSFHNLTIQTPDGTTQIDHVYVSPYGVFVVETKNLKGWIFGSEKQSQWTQQIFKKKYRFQNPLRQNYKHVKALEVAFDIPGHMIHSVVVFAGRSTFKTDMPENVTQGLGYIRYIKSFQDEVLSQEEVDDLVGRIESDRLTPSRETQRRHIDSLKVRHSSQADQICPRCGSLMVLRRAKSGTHAGQKFWGCSTFPKCRAVKSLS